MRTTLKSIIRNILPNEHLKLLARFIKIRRANKPAIVSNKRIKGNSLQEGVKKHQQVTIYRYCGEYLYNDPTIVGFSHTHLSGTSHSDLSDFLVMPTTGEVRLNPGTSEKPETGYRSHFSHEPEKAESSF